MLWKLHASGNVFFAFLTPNFFISFLTIILHQLFYYGKFCCIFFLNFLFQVFFLQIIYWPTEYRYKKEYQTAICSNELLSTVTIHWNMHSNFKVIWLDLLCKYRSSTIIFIIFWDFLMFYQILFPPEVKRCAFIAYKHGIYELPNELPNDLQSEEIRKYQESLKNFIES